MPTPLVLQHQKAEVVKILEESGQIPSAFSWVDDPSAYWEDAVASTLHYKPGDYYFRIDKSTDGYWTYTLCPADKEWVHGPERSSYWTRVLEASESWAGYVSGELKAKSYLAIAMNNRQLLQLPQPEDMNLPFSEQEQHQIIERLDAIELELLGFRQNDDDFRADVKVNFDCLRDEAARGGRTAFRYALFGALLAVGLEFLTSEETKHIIDFATQQVNQLGLLLTHSSST